MGHTKALPSNLKLLKASDEDCKIHEKILADIAKASKKDCVWSLENQSAS